MSAVQLARYRSDRVDAPIEWYSGHDSSVATLGGFVHGSLVGSSSKIVVISCPHVGSRLGPDNVEEKMDRTRECLFHD